MRTPIAAFLQAAALLLVLAGCQSKPEPTGPAVEPPRSDQPPVDLAASHEVVRILEQAIAAHGGLDQLRAADQWTARTHGTYMGMTYQSTTTFDGKDMRMDVSMPDGESMAMVMGAEQCWTRSGLVVLLCSEAERQANRDNAAWQRVTRLYPIKDGEFTTRAGSTEIDGRAHPTLLVRRAGLEGEASLAFDPDSQLLVRFEMPGTFAGRKGRLRFDYSHPRKACGVSMPGRLTTWLDGQQVMEEHVGTIVCGPVDAGLFPPPLQVADGTVQQKTTAPATLACKSVSGPWSGIGPAVGQLVGEAAQQQLNPMGPPVMTYLKAPPEVQEPAEFVTEVCIPVAAPPPAAAEQRGGVTLRAGQPTKVLAIYGLGDYAKRSGELTEQLMGALAERKLKAAGALRQVTYHRPGEIPAEQMVSEMQVPVE